MCQRVTCTTCQKPTYTGCGRHIEQVLGDVAKADRCHCRDAEQAGTEKKSSLLGWLFGR